MSDVKQSTGTPLRAAIAVLGLSSFLAGGLAVFVTANGTGAAALLTVGAVLLLIGVLGDRLEALEIGNTKLHLRAAAAAKYEQADVLEREGDPAAADALRTQARALLEAADPLAARYAAIRASESAGPARTRAMEQVVEDARRSAASETFEPKEVISWLREGNDERRVVALAMMQERPELRDADLTMAAIAHSRSAFEQYHALRLATEMLDDLDTDQRRRLVDIIRDQQRRLRFRRDTSRWRLSEQILKRVDDPPNQ